MIVHLRAEATSEDVERVLVVASAGGASAQVAPAGGAVGIGGGTSGLAAALGSLPGVASVSKSSVKYPLGSRAFRPEKSVIAVGDVRIGGPAPVIIAGPGTVESEAPLLATAPPAKDAGADLLGGGPLKPRS